MPETVRLGIVGFGAQGATYAKLIADGRVSGMVLGAIATNGRAKAGQVEQQHPGVTFFDDYIEMLESGTVDAVVATVPNYLHPEVAIAALTRGLHVMVEKPAGVYTKQVAELNAFAAARPELTFAMMFNQRNNPLYRRLKEIIDAGEIGAIRRTNWMITTWWRPQGYYDQSAWRGTWGGEGGGVLVNQAPHQLDLWQWLCGVPRSVFAKVSYGYRRDIAVEDEVTAIVDYGDGVTGVFVTATHDVDGTDRLEIHGETGKIVVEQSRTATVTRLNAFEVEIGRRMELAEIQQLHIREFDATHVSTREVVELSSAWGVQHAAVLENFAANILNGTPLLAPGADGIASVRLANAIHLSSWLGREVGLDFDEDEYLAILNQRISDEGRYPLRS
jgi:predicted dehydrogenase